MEKYSRYLQFLCHDLGHRLSATANEERAAQWVFSVLKNMGLRTGIDTFSTPSSAYSIYQVIFLLGFLISFFYTQLDIMIRLFLIIVEGFLLFLFYNEFHFQHTFLYRWLQTRKSRNVYAEVLPGIEQKQQIIIIAHYDSAANGVLFYPQWVRFLPLLVRISFYSFISLILVSLLALFYFHPYMHYFYLLLSFFYMFSFMICLHSEYFAAPGQGANDNASSVSILLNLAEYFRNSRLENTGLTFLFTGAEENGCIGIYEYLKQQRNFMDQNTCFLVLECTGIGHPVLLSSEGMLKKYYPDQALYRFALQTAKAQSFKMETRALPSGYTELEVIRNFGFKGLVLGTKEERPDRIAYWHQQNDTLEHLQYQSLDEVFRYLCSLIKNLDQWHPEYTQKTGIRKE